MNKSLDWDIAGDLADFALSTNYENIPEEAVIEAKKAIIDSIGVTIAGSESEAGNIVCEFICDLAEKPVATIIGKKFKASLLSAALANGTMAHALDFDDSNISLHGHPSAPLLPAILAVGEDREVTGKDLLEAYILGFEIESKIGSGVNVNHNNKGWHSTSTLGIFGAVAGVGKIIDLNKEQMIAAFGIASSLCSGTKQNFGTMTKPFHAGNSAKSGITACLLAKRNFTASGTPFEGKFGFFDLFCDPGRYSISDIVDNLGNPFDIISPGVIIKPYPCCGSTHPAIDALKMVMQSGNLCHEDVKAIRVGVSFIRPKSLRYNDPKSVLQAKFSMPFCLAVTALEGDIKLADFSVARLTDRKVQELMPKISMYVHPDMDDETTFNYYQEFALVSVLLDDGREYSHKWEYIRRKGSRQNPLSGQELLDKYRDCTENVLGQTKATATLDLLEHLEDVQNIKELMDLL